MTVSKDAMGMITIQLNEKDVPSAENKPQGPSNAKRVSALLLWFTFNALTLLLNKFLFAKLQFSYPFALTAVHMATCSFFAFLIIKVFKWIPFQQQSRSDIIRHILPLAVIFCVNIVLGNVSLRFIPISFMQTVKSSVPVFTVIIQTLFLRKTFEQRVYLALIPVVGGVALASFTESSFDMTGFLCAVFASITTAVQAVMMNLLLASGMKKMDPINLLFYMGPLSFAMLVPAVFMFEWQSISTEWIYFGQPAPLLWLFVGGAVAFALNYSSFVVSSVVSTLTMTVSGNLKAVINIVVSVAIFGNPIGLMNWIGCLVAIGGVMWYQHIMMNPRPVEPVLPIRAVASPKTTGFVLASERRKSTPGLSALHRGSPRAPGLNLITAESINPTYKSAHQA
eukprot:TRINITY_DN336_c0_g1_i3.p1 TRINITY_DN336_c0_g1~~TRINITY_DN336_c0_g1_i3.p1  ORF type:complete len:416 (+),score=114.27 TRINITY_DN336_c0_g1_i3:64-1248(+)